MSVFQVIYDFITIDIYNLITEAVAFIILHWTLFSLKLQLSFMQFSWDVASVIIADLQITQKINESLNLLPNDVVQKLHFFNVTSGLNLIINAAVTRYVMGFIR